MDQYPFLAVLLLIVSPETVYFGSGQGRSEFETTVVACSVADFK
jgi:hypothetical protein